MPHLESLGEFVMEEPRRGGQRPQNLASLFSASDAAYKNVSMLQVGSDIHLGHDDKSAEAGVLYLASKKIADLLANEAVNAFQASCHVATPLGGFLYPVELKDVTDLKVVVVLEEDSGFKPYPSENASHQWLETHPHAAFCALLGQLPLPKPTLEGRLQRQVALYEQGTGIKDPMVFFEEITRHKLLHGSLPMECVYAAEELDTLMAAYMAYHVVNYPQEMLLVGDRQEGQIALPLAKLKERYS